MEHAYWKQMIEIEENGIFLVFGITRNDQIKFLHFSSVPQAEDMSVVCGIFHARDECDRLWMLFQIIFNFVMSGDGVVIGQDERVHVICHHKVRQFFAGKYCVGFVGMIV